MSGIRFLRSAPAGVFLLTAFLAACGLDRSEPERQRADDLSVVTSQAVDVAMEESAMRLAAANGIGAMVPAASKAAVEEPTSTSFWDGLSSGQMVIRTGNATLEVESLDAGLEALRLAAAAADGYVANLDFQTGAQQVRRASVQIKVPSDRFEDLLTAVKPIGELQGLALGAGPSSKRCS